MNMPRIEISDHDFKRLQAYAEPFVDTPATALTKVLDLLDKGGLSDSLGPSSVTGHPNRRPAPRFEVYGPTSLPPLTHTKLVSGKFGGAEPQKLTWDSLVQLALESLHDRYEDVREVRKRAGANVVSGAKTDDGYKFLSDKGFSYQGVSAEDAAKIILRSARDLEAELLIEFVWRDKPEAYKPGQAGRIEL